MTSVLGIQLSTSGWSIVTVQSEGTPAISDTNQLLQKGMVFNIMAMPPAALYPNDAFTIEVNPSVGASLSIHRTIPAATQPVNILY